MSSLKDLEQKKHSPFKRSERKASNNQAKGISQLRKKEFLDSQENWIKKKFGDLRTRPEQFGPGMLL